MIPRSRRSLVSLVMSVWSRNRQSSGLLFSSLSLLAGWDRRQPGRKVVILSIAIIALRVFYLTCLGALALYACGQIYLLYTYVRHQLTHTERRTRTLPLSETDELVPRVTVQLPLYNERYVARRIIEAAAALDYPRDRLHIQVLDDSTDDTPERIQSRILQLQSEGLHIDLVHRSNRTGYKAGALANGLSRTDGEFIAIFDADFIPKPDFLKRTVPYFHADECIGVVQARWGHLNGSDNLLTRSQTLAIDAHFAVEQCARSASSLLFSFNRCCVFSGSKPCTTIGSNAAFTFRCLWCSAADWRLTTAGRCWRRFSGGTSSSSARPNFTLMANRGTGSAAAMRRPCAMT